MKTLKQLQVEHVANILLAAMNENFAKVRNTLDELGKSILKK